MRGGKSRPGCVLLAADLIFSGLESGLEERSPPQRLPGTRRLQGNPVSPRRGQARGARRSPGKEPSPLAGGRSGLAVTSPSSNPLPGCRPAGQGAHRAPGEPGPSPALGCHTERLHVEGTFLLGSPQIQPKQQFLPIPYRVPPSSKHTPLRMGICPRPRARCDPHAGAPAAAAGGGGGGKHLVTGRQGTRPSVPLGFHAPCKTPWEQ